jgi:uncharacterized protein (TIGR00255 family)
MTGPIRSMTGFGRAVVEEEGAAVRVEVRSVNHRHLQVKSRLPGELGHLEPVVEGLVRKALDRGAVTLNVALTRTLAAGVTGINLEVARGYQKTLQQLGRELGVGGVDLAALLTLPGVVGTPEGDETAGDEEALVLRAVKQALAALVGMREDEGRSLEDDLKKNATAVGKLVASVEERMPVVVREHHENLVKRVNDLLANHADGRGDGRSTVSEADLPRELALLADRMDVSEEVTRIGSHLAQLDQMIAGGGGVGRKLDFLVQELFREANTIGSKCNDAITAHLVVDLKTHIERLREQVQNVE